MFGSRNSGRALLAMAGALVVAVATACGGSTSSNNTGSQQLTGKPILLGSVLTIKNPAWSNENVRLVNDAWGNYANSELNGVSGHPIQVISCDDEGDPAKSRSCVQDLLDKGVVAFVNNSSLAFGANSLPLVEAANVANLGGWPVSPPEYSSKYNFPTTPGASGSYPSIAEYFFKAGAKRLAVAVTDTPSGLGVADQLKKQWTALGGESFKSVAFSATAADYVPVATQLQQANPDAVILAVGEGPAPRMFKAVQTVGLKAKIGATATAATKTVFDAAGDAVEGTYFSMAVVPPATAGNNDITLYKRVMKKYAPNVELSNQTGVAASSMQFAVKSLQSVKGDVTRASVYQYLQGVRSSGAAADNFLAHPMKGSDAPSTSPALWNKWNLMTQYHKGNLEVQGKDLPAGKDIDRQGGITWITGFAN